LNGASSYIYAIFGRKSGKIMKKNQSTLFLVFAAALLVALATPPPAAAQGCSLCYQSAASAGSRAIQGLRNGIVVLILPPLFICMGISYLVYRRRNLYSDNL
jgi:hypothetical protein